MADRRLPREAYTVGWVCALPVELAAAEEMLDERHGDSVTGPKDSNIYTLGRIGEHNVVIACLPEAQMGTNSAAAVAAQMQSAFTSIRIGLMVGIGGGVPSTNSDIRLGDVVVSRPENSHGGVVQYDFGKSTPSGFQRTGFLNAPPKTLRNAVSRLRAKHMRDEAQFLQFMSKFDRLPTFTREYAGSDVLFDAQYNHVGGLTCEDCDEQRILIRRDRGQQEGITVVHYGTIASGNQVMRDAAERDRVSSELGGVLCFEMEAAGLLNEFPCLVIRGICDYSDSHKNKRWQPYAAGVAAVYAKELLSTIPAIEITQFLVESTAVARKKTFFTIPYQRDENFVGRESIMTDLDDKMQSMTAARHIRVALVGIGGIGKSQIAIEYAYRARQRNPELSVFWVYAGSVARYEQAYKDLADKLDLPGRADPGVDILKLVSQWLSDDVNGQWLMILDNADNEDMFFNEPKANGIALITSIPQTTNGSVLITTRGSTAARNLLTTTYQNIVSVEVMDANDALDLFQTRVALDKHSLEDARKLVQTLEYIPLAISHASAYIQARSPRITVSAYLALLQESDASLAALLSHLDVRDSRRDYSSQHVVTATWQITFDQIRTSQPASSDLLALMSMFDRHRIPETLLLQNRTRGEFEDAIHPLISFSLIRESKDQQSFEIHRLVQISMRKWLESHNQLQKWSIISAEIIARSFPSGEFETWKECQILLPHAMEVLRQAPENNSPMPMNQTPRPTLRQRLKGKLTRRHREKPTADNRESLPWAEIGKKAGWYLFLQGRYQEAEAMLRQVLRGTEKILGPKHPDTLASINNLGSVLGEQGKYQEAEAMHRQALREKEKVLGPEHPNTLASVNNLGLVLGDQGKYQEAEAMHRRALREREKVLGPEHPNTLASVNNLGLALGKQGKYQEAEVMHQRALRGYEKVLGPEHPDTLRTAQALILALECQGKHQEAETVHQRVRSVR
ncbi:hypothetical protein ASPZODRAFT_105081 [Penicilliopsis zonata CBS 506.65]|uniref:Uncharacterized protein n=1 Tax=Penicilliopsis zonata CBS 506.65 TaxID=1073090 RepID=A0A1L9S643_9EURO|nr:hypothetical protein ASPZODRAFT_105081 [Penicilliopsis zonata CBS 506.65]OJJ42627.1 hypothetical protein ASPZODRAFT_105081 [Penicilliopsis zonata CBS 506.65]